MIGRDERDLVGQVAPIQVGSDDVRGKTKQGHGHESGWPAQHTARRPIGLKNEYLPQQLRQVGRCGQTRVAVAALGPDAGVTVVVPTKDEEGAHRGDHRSRRGRTPTRFWWSMGIQPIAHGRLRRRMGARVVLDAGRGKGEALRRSFDEARHEILVFIDADGSHDPKDIPHLIEPIRAGKAELVIASRTRGGSDELHGTAEQLLRYIGSQLIMLAINYRWQVRLTDSQNGFRALRKRCRARAPADVESDDHRAGNADARPEVRLPRRGDSEPRVRAPLGRVEGQRVAVVVGMTSGRCCATSCEGMRTIEARRAISPICLG